MSKFIQLHILTSYPPANLNRDDQGRPKTAKMGGTERLRISSQSLKRNWRVSGVFINALKTESAEAVRIGIRTKRLGLGVYENLINKGVGDTEAKKWSQAIAEQFGKLKKEDKSKPLQELEIEQLVHISQSENNAIDQLVATLASENREPETEELQLLRKTERDVDIALFGRMLASKPEFNVEAACQVSHALSVHSIVIEDDYFTAVDDLNDGKDDAGAAHIGEASFASGLFYTYVCINKSQLEENLQDETLVNRAISALTEATVKVSPQGKQNSFASRAYASYVLAEMGEQQPRSLSAAFLKAINSKESEDFAMDAIKRLRAQFASFDSVYGDCADSRYELNVLDSEGSLQELLSFVGN